jgi:Carboxypeptidase regulatory-like domain
MLKQNKQIKCLERLLIALMTLFIGPAWAASLGTISGQVLDSNGVPIAGVTVSTQDAVSVVTNPGGVFTLRGVKQKSIILIDFAKNGYTSSQGKTALMSGATNITTTTADEGGAKLLQATLIKT